MAANPDDAALLGTLLGLVNPRDVSGVVAAVLARFGSFARVLAAEPALLRQVPGLGSHSVAAIKLMQGAALRLARARVLDQLVFDQWERLIAYLTASMARDPVEQFRILFLDDADRLLHDEAQARGTVNHTPVYPREVVKRALGLKAAAIILVHNHPTGDPTPSAEDIAMTREIGVAAAALGVALRDHVIIATGRWFSFRAEGLLSP